MAVQELAAVAEEQKTQRSKGHLARAMARLVRKKIAVTCIAVLSVIYFAGIFAAWVSPYDYTAQDYTVIRKAPSYVLDQGPLAFWTESHFAGTDRAGRDLFTRVLWGIQNTVILTLVAMLTGGLLIGVSLGLIAGYYGKRVDSFIMRIGEVFASFPDIFLVIIIAATLRPRILGWVRALEDRFDFLDGIVRIGVVDYFVVSIALVGFGWIGMARLVRGQILFLKENQYIEAARASGASTARVLFMHLLPNAIAPIVVTVSAGMGAYVGTEIILSWLGLGIQPPRPSLGTMLLEGGHISVIREEPWMLLSPGIAAWLLILCWNLLGDALNDVLNPRTR